MITPTEMQKLEIDFLIITIFKAVYELLWLIQQG